MEDIAVTTYSELCGSVFPKIKDYGLISLDEQDALAIIQDYLVSAIVLFSGCTQDLSDRDDESAEFHFKLTDINFEILSNYMAICYLDSNYIRIPEMLKAHMSTTDFHKYDNKDTLSKVIETRNMYKTENDRLMINYSHQSSNIFEQILKRGSK